MLEEEVYSQNSPIWDPDFITSTSRSSQLGIQTGKYCNAKQDEDQNRFCVNFIQLMDSFVPLINA